MPPGKNKKQPAEFNSAAPLKCWDIFMGGYRSMELMAEDMQQLNKMTRTYAWQPAWNLEEKFLQQRKIVLVTDVSQRIVFASNNISAMNGYLPAEVIGKTPKIFQGKDTNLLSKAIISEAIKELQPFHVPLLNYKKNGELYHCDIEGFPVFNRQKKLMHFIAFETLEHDH